MSVPSTQGPSPGGPQTRHPQGCPGLTRAENLVHGETQELTSVWAQVKTGSSPSSKSF